VAQRLATGLHACGFRIPRHLLVPSRDRQRPLRAFLMPEGGRTASVCGAAGQARAPRRHGLRGEVDPPILPAFALYEAKGWLRPVDLVHRAVDHLGNPQATSPHEQEEGLIHRVVDRRKELLDLVLRESFGQRPPPAHQVTWFDRIPSDAPLLEEIVEERFQRLQAAMEGDRGSPLGVLLSNKPLDVLTRDAGGRPWTDRKAHLEIQGIVGEGVRRILAAQEIRLEAVDGLAHRLVHGPFSFERLARLDRCHGLGIWGPLGGLRDLGIAPCQGDGAVPHQRLAHCQRAPSIEELRRQGRPQRRRRIAMGDACSLAIT
jgi:hypothetical protein